MNGQVLKKVFTAPLCLILFCSTLSSSFILSRKNYLKDKPVNISYRRQKNIFILPPGYSSKIQAKHGTKVAIFLAALNISLEAKNYITSVLDKATET